MSIRIKEGNYKTTYSHSDPRSDGGAMYTKIYPSRDRRLPDNSSGNSPAIRSCSQSNQGRESTGTRNNTTQRSTNTETNKSITNPQPEQNVSTSRRSTNTVIIKSVSKPASGLNAGTNRTYRQSTTEGSSSNRWSSESSKSGTIARQSEKTKQPDSQNDTSRR